MEEIEFKKNINEIFNRQFNKICNELKSRIMDNEIMRMRLIDEVISIKHDIRLLNYMLLGKEKINEKNNIGEVLDKSVDIVFFKNVRIRNCFKAEGITTLHELVYYTKEDLLFLPNMGKGSVNIIINTLNELGLQLGMIKMGV